MIVVTGGAGMIGSAIVHALNRAGERDILVVDDLTDGTKFRNLVDADIADYEDKDRFIEQLERGDHPGIRVIFHQGACSTTTEWDGRFMMNVNYRFSKRLFDWCQKARVPFLYASSAAVYGAGNRFVEDPANERPLNVYGWSKKLFDDWVRRRLGSLKAPVVGLRYFNVYGPREAHKGSMASVAWHLFQQVQRGENPKLFGAYDGFGAGQQSRDFIHVDDVAAVNLWAWRAGVSGVFNCGSGHAQPFLDVANAVIAAVSKGYVEYIDFPEHLKGRYQSYTQADLTALRSAGFDGSFYSVADGVRSYTDWLQTRG